MTSRRLLTAGQVGRQLGVNRWWVYRAWERGALPFLELDDGSRRMTSAQLAEALERAAERARNARRARSATRSRRPCAEAVALCSDCRSRLALQ